MGFPCGLLDTVAVIVMESAAIVRVFRAGVGADNGTCFGGTACAAPCVRVRPQPNSSRFARGKNSKPMAALNNTKKVCITKLKAATCG